MPKIAIDIPARELKLAVPFHKRIYSIWKIEHMAKEDILAVVPKEVQEEIKREDPEPIYRAYAIAHEGTAKGTMVGFGAIIKRYIASAIRKIVEKLGIGTKVFHTHEGADDKDTDRKPIGKVVGKKIEEWRNRLTAFAVMYIYPEFRTLPLDVASIEADLLIDPKKPDEIGGVNVDKITGIALGNSAAGWMPGFEGAELVAELRAFAGQSHKGGDVDKITIDELKDLVKADKLKPSDIFGVETLTADPAVEGFVEAERKKATAGEYAHRKRDEEGFNKTKSELEEKLKAKGEEVKTLKVAAAKSRVGSIFEKIKGERKLDERQEKYIRPALDKFEPKEADAIDKELETFVDEKVQEYNRIAKDVFGVESGEGQEKKTGAEGSTGGKIENPLIPRRI